MFLFNKFYFFRISWICLLYSTARLLPLFYLTFSLLPFPLCLSSITATTYNLVSSLLALLSSHVSVHKLSQVQKTCVEKAEVWPEFWEPSHGSFKRGDIFPFVYFISPENCPLYNSSTESGSLLHIFHIGTLCDNLGPTSAVLEGQACKNTHYTDLCV